MKIGLVQTAAQTADFPRNLRNLVQGYRHCVDHGAALVVADAFSLSGPYPLDLKDRSSFLKQTESALKALSEEIGAVPLLLGTYARPVGVGLDEAFRDEEGLLPETAPGSGEGGLRLMPHLIEEGACSVVEDELVQLESGVRIYAVCEGSVDAFGFEADVLVALPHEPWYVGAQCEREDERRWDATQEDKPLVSVCPVGAADGNIWNGGSTVHTADGRLIARLPLFAPASQVIDTGRATDATALPSAASMLRQALVAGLADHARRNGYEEVSLALGSRSSSLLLARLAAEALGVEHVTLFCCEEPAEAVRTWLVKTGLVDALKRLPAKGETTEENPSLRSRLTMARVAFESEMKGAMLLCALTRGELLAGTSLEEAQGALLLPFGDVYEGDLRLLAEEMSAEGMPPLPESADSPAAEYDRAFQLIEDGNRSVTELLDHSECPLSEATLRKAQRLLVASAWKRRCMPPVLETTCVGKRRRYPAMQRMND